MPRIKINLPKTFNFSTQTNLRVSDINYSGHLGNDAVLSLIHEARLRFLEQYGYDEYNLAGVGLIMVDCAIIYKSEGFYGDLIEMQVAIDDFTKHSFDLFYRLKNIKTGKDLVHAKTRMVCFDYQARKIQLLPPIFRNIFEKEASER
ncbi:MAG: thioesterase family protein [Cytophagales bacterium]|nr:thioesterase family protein [Cytophagales bacterium]